MKEYILDSCSLICFVLGEKGSLQVKKILDEAFESKAILRIPAVNLGEVYYILYRNNKDDQFIMNFFDYLINSLGLQIFSSDYSDCLKAAKFKAGGGLAYQDGFILNLATKYPNSLIITKVKEFQQFKDSFHIQII